MKQNNSALEIVANPNLKCMILLKYILMHLTLFLTWNYRKKVLSWGEENLKLKDHFEEYNKVDGLTIAFGHSWDSLLHMFKDRN